MGALRKVATQGRDRGEDLRLREPEAINAVPRPMVGLFAQLTEKQRAAALAYRGPEGHGDSAFLLRLREHA
jgi:hypothetical protein